MDWEDRLDDWELELELNAQLDGSDWVTLERAAAETGVSRAALRSWYRTGQIPSRLATGPQYLKYLEVAGSIHTADRRRLRDLDRDTGTAHHQTLGGQDAYRLADGGT